MDINIILPVALAAGIAIGCVIGWLKGKALTAAMASKADLMEANNQQMQQQMAQTQQQTAQLQRDLQLAQTQQAQLMASEQAMKAQLQAEQQHHQEQLKALNESAQQHLDELKAQHEHQVDTLKEAHEQRMKQMEAQMLNERQYAREMQQASDKQWAQKLEALRNDMQKTAAEQLAAKQSALQENNRTQMDELLKPIKEQFADFKRAVEESKTRNEVNKQELQSTFQATMKLFQQEQQQTVANLKEQTLRIGSDAANLTRALKGDSKMQGDWGEMVLETILENSGLRKDEEFFIQENTKDGEGNNFRPDVIVRFPEGRSVVIDSKVSLTAYTEAVATDDDATREHLLKAHAQSVRRHIDELANKDYSQLVDDAIGFVLMFIPNETSYMAAMKQQPDLSRYAYQKKIIIISPSNLLMALQLAYNLWQYDRQNKNVEKIVKAAADLYDKVATFEDTFSSIGDMLARLSASYDKARKQLYDGTGNVMRRVENLKQLGVTPKKRLKVSDDDE